MNANRNRHAQLHMIFANAETISDILRPHFDGREDSLMLQRLPHLLLAAIALTTACLVAAQPYPNRPIRIITPFGPGNAGDIIPRAIAPHMIQTLKQNIVMDNRPGAGGNIASEIVARGVDPMPSTPAECSAFMRSELAKWARVVKASGAKAN